MYSLKDEAKDEAESNIGKEAKRRKGVSQWRCKNRMKSLNDMEG